MSSEVFLPENNPHSANTRVVDLTAGPQHGAMQNPENWTASAFYPRPNLQAVLVQAPKGFAYLPDGAGMVRRLKAMVETKCKSISGLVSTLTVESDEVMVDKGTEAMQTPTKVNRERSNPNMVWNEYRGMPIWKDLSLWVRMLIEHPKTGAPGVIDQPAYQAAGAPELTAEYYSMIVLFIQANHNLTGVDYAWLCSNMYPQSVPFEGGVEYGAARPLVEMPIDWTALTLHGEDVDAVMVMAKEYIDSINKSGYSPSALAPFVAGISSDLLEDATGNLGYRGGVNKIAEAL